MDPGAVLQPGVHNRRRCIDRPVYPADDLPDQLHKLFPGFKGLLPSSDPPFGLHEHLLRAVDHDLCDPRIVHQLLQDIQSPKGIKQLLLELQPVSEGHGGLLRPLQDLSVNDLGQLLIRHLTLIGHALEDLLPQLPL